VLSAKARGTHSTSRQSATAIGGTNRFIGAHHGFRPQDCQRPDEGTLETSAYLADGVSLRARTSRYEEDEMRGLGTT
jgi:hypothetical protein